MLDDRRQQREQAAEGHVEGALAGDPHPPAGQLGEAGDGAVPLDGVFAAVVLSLALGWAAAEMFCRRGV